MDTVSPLLLQFLLSNALAAALLAGVVFLVTRFWRRPTVVYALWMLVLFKLVSPPLVEVPFVTASLPAEARVTELSAAEFAALAPGPRAGVVGPLSASPGGSSVATGSPGPSSGAFLAPALEALRGLPWVSLFLGAWALGTAAWLALAFFRVRRFRRLLAASAPAPARVQELTRRLAEEFGLRSAPEVKVTRGQVPPILWSLGRSSTVVIPEPLLARLETEQLQTLIVHELAHLCRRDHWVRLFEILVLAIYWWNPVAYWARKELQDAGEECCDGWVLGRFPERARLYAQTLLETVDYLAEPPPRPLPLAANGFGKATRLKRRFEMILTGRKGGRVPFFVKALVVLVGFGVLPLAPLGVRAETACDEKIVITSADGRTTVFTVDAATAKKIRALLAERGAEKSAPAPKADVKRKKLIVSGGGAGSKGMHVIELEDGGKGGLLQLEDTEAQRLIELQGGRKGGLLQREDTEAKRLIELEALGKGGVHDFTISDGDGRKKIIRLRKGEGGTFSFGGDGEAEVIELGDGKVIVTKDKEKGYTVKMGKTIVIGPDGKKRVKSWSSKDGDAEVVIELPEGVKDKEIVAFEGEVVIVGPDGKETRRRWSSKGDSKAEPVIVEEIEGVGGRIKLDLEKVDDFHDRSSRLRRHHEELQRRYEELMKESKKLLERMEQLRRSHESGLPRREKHEEHERHEKRGKSDAEVFFHFDELHDAIVKQLHGHESDALHSGLEEVFEKLHRSTEVEEVHEDVQKAVKEALRWLKKHQSEKETPSGVPHGHGSKPEPKKKRASTVY